MKRDNVLSLLKRYRTALPGGEANDQQYVLLLSHMRSYSSLLGHIVGTHSEISGFAEAHQSYRNRLDLFRLRYKVSILTREKPSTYLFDKLLHNNYRVAQQFLRHPRFRVVLTVRRPEATIKSIINMGYEHSKTVPWYRDPQRVLRYYIYRLKRLHQYATGCRGSALYFNAEELVETPQTVLQGLQDFLKLEAPLTEEYQRFGLTGMKGLGDPSEHIQSGRIIQDRPVPDVEVPPEILDRANRVYHRLVPRITQKCRGLGGGWC
ncbi:MAG: hypothetical protein ACWA5K_03565 [bacterium]